MTLPALGLALGRRPPETLVPLLVAARRWCRPVTIDTGTGRPAAILASAALADRVREPVPMALWTRSAEEAASQMSERAAAIISDEPSIADAAGSRGVFAAVSHQAEHRRAMPPFVRERLRLARGMPAVSLLEQTVDGWRWSGRSDSLDQDLVATGMACASAVAVCEPERLLEALAWGAPCACDAGSAEQVGAVPGTHVLVGGHASERLALASRLAADSKLAARLSWAGRRLVERRHDAGRAAMRLVELLALLPSPHEHPTAVATLQLSLLGSPTFARIANTFAEATAHLTAQ